MAGRQGLDTRDAGNDAIVKRDIAPCLDALDNRMVLS